MGYRRLCTRILMTSFTFHPLLQDAALIKKFNLHKINAEQREIITKIQNAGRSCLPAQLIILKHETGWEAWEYNDDPVFAIGWIAIQHGKTEKLDTFLQESIEETFSALSKDSLFIDGCHEYCLDCLERGTAEDYWLCTSTMRHAVIEDVKRSGGDKETLGERQHEAEDIWNDWMMNRLRPLYTKEEVLHATV